MVKERPPLCHFPRGYRGCRSGIRVQAEKAASRAAGCSKAGSGAAGCSKAASGAAGCGKAASGATPAAQLRLGMAETYVERARKSLRVAKLVNTKQAWAEADAAIRLAERDILDFRVRQLKPKNIIDLEEKVLEETLRPTEISRRKLASVFALSALGSECNLGWDLGVWAQAVVLSITINVIISFVSNMSRLAARGARGARPGALGALYIQGLVGTVW